VVSVCASIINEAITITFSSSVAVYNKLSAVCALKKPLLVHKRRQKFQLKYLEIVAQSGFVSGHTGLSQVEFSGGSTYCVM
jgi:hypothetical protein